MWAPRAGEAAILGVRVLGRRGERRGEVQREPGPGLRGRERCRDGTGRAGPGRGWCEWGSTWRSPRTVAETPGRSLRLEMSRVSSGNNGESLFADTPRCWLRTLFDLMSFRWIILLSSHASRVLQNVWSIAYTSISDPVTAEIDCGGSHVITPCLPEARGCAAAPGHVMEGTVRAGRRAVHSRRTDGHGRLSRAHAALLSILVLLLFWLRPFHAVPTSSAVTQ